MQYKEAMQRMKRLNCANQTPQSHLEGKSETKLKSIPPLLPSVETEDFDRPCRPSDKNTRDEGNGGSIRGTLANQVMATMKVIVPLKIVLLIVKILLIMFFLEDVKRLVHLWYMPLLGVVAACLANCVPIGGGIVYVPALALLGSDMKLGVSFSVATMTIGNGIFGFLNWQRRDPSLLVWEAVPFTVLPSSVGTLCSRLLGPPPTEAGVKTFFALFCFLLGVFVFFSVHKGGIANVVREYSWSSGVESSEGDVAAGSDDEARLSCFESAEGDHDDGKCIHSGMHSARAAGDIATASTWVEWCPLAVVSFLAGLLLVPNIAIGPSLTTFLGLVLMGFPERDAMVTGIVVGGWASIAPFLLHVCVDRDVPWESWLMVLPGVLLGAWLAPKVQTLIGIENALIAFGVFLLGTFVLFMTH